MAKFNFIKNIPPKARFMLITVVIVSVGSVFAFYKLMASPGAQVGDSVAGDVNVKLNPTEQQISKASPDEKSIIPEGSPLDKQLQDIRKKKIEDAKTSEKSFIDELKVKNTDRVLEDVKQKIDQENQQPVSGIDDILAERRQQKKEEAKTLEQRRQELLAQQQNQKENRQQRNQQRSAPIFDEDKWLKDQLNTVDNVSNSNDQVISEIADRTRTMSDYGQSMTRQAVSASQAQSASNAGTNNGKDSYIGSYIRSPDQLPDMNLAQLDADRRLAGQSRSGRNYQNADSSNGSSNGNSGSASQQQASAYEQSVYPTGMSPQDQGTYVPAGTIYYAVLEIGVNTDEVSPVRALVVQEGPLKNAVLIGAPERVGEKVVISFNKMSIDGRDYSIDAVALDPETMRSAIADDVDNHTFERYFKLATAAALSGYAEALTATSTTKYSDGSQQQVQERLPKTEDQIAVAVGSVGEKLIPIYEKEFGREPTVRVFPNRDLGIMLMSGLQVQ